MDREAAMKFWRNVAMGSPDGAVTGRMIEEFAPVVEAAERERCAKLCEQASAEGAMLSGEDAHAPTHCAVELLVLACRRCGGLMKPGLAIEQTFVSGSPDFIGGRVVTMSAGGPGKLIECVKCSACGHSVTPNA